MKIKFDLKWEQVELGLIVITQRFTINYFFALQYFELVTF